MERDVADLKDLYEEAVFREGPGAPGAADGCLRKGDMELFFDAGTPRKVKLEIVDHMTSCPECARYFRFLLELDRQRDEFAEAVEARLADGRRPDPGERPPSIHIGHPFLIPALGLILIAVISAILILGRQPAGPEVQRATGGQIVLLEPGGMIEAGKVVFRWEGHPKAESYILEICDQSLKVIWKSETILGTEFSLPGPVLDKLEGGGPYLWSVTAYAGESRIAESGVLKFFIGPARH